MKEVARILARQSREKAAEFRAKAAEASGMAKDGYLDLAAMHDLHAFNWEVISL